MLRLAISVVCGMRAAIARGEHEHHPGRANHNHDDRSDGNLRRRLDL